MTVEVEVNLHGNMCCKLFSNNDTIEKIESKINTLLIGCIRGHTDLIIYIFDYASAQADYTYIYKFLNKITLNDKKWLLSKILCSLTHPEITVKIFDNLIQNLEEIIKNID